MSVILKRGRSRGRDNNACYITKQGAGAWPLNNACYPKEGPGHGRDNNACYITLLF
jgi:hypothetical protein